MKHNTHTPTLSEYPFLIGTIQARIEARRLRKLRRIRAIEQFKKRFDAFMDTWQATVILGGVLILLLNALYRLMILH